MKGSAIRCRTNWLVQYDGELAIGKRGLYGCTQMLAWFEFRQKREIGDVTLPRLRRRDRLQLLEAAPRKRPCGVFHAFIKNGGRQGRICLSRPEVLATEGRAYLGLVNTYIFAPGLLREKCAGKARGAEHSRLWPFVAHRLQRPTLPCGSCLALVNPSPPRAAK